VKAIAKDLGADLCEWTTPVPTLWAEHVHANSGSLVVLLFLYLLQFWRSDEDWMNSTSTLLSCS
jgi:cell cycle checkpoint protein